MCGITGFYDISGQDERQKIQHTAEAMEQAVFHRGPDAGDVWQDPDLPLALGHRRLSILDLSNEGAQPMASHQGRYVISYNGEVYNFLELRRDLERAGAVFKGRSDTEVILSAIEVWGLNLTLQKINGMFAFALWDRQDKTLHLVRDRLGKKPLYIGWAGAQNHRYLVFGSELKSLRAHPAFQPRLNREALSLYMRYGYVPAPHSIYEGIWTLLPGHWMSLKLPDLKGSEHLKHLMKPYWNHLNVLQESRTHPSPSNDKDIVQNFETLLTHCVQDRMISDVPLGAFLSGGIDSSTIVALMQKLSPRPIKTYTIGFNETGFNEAEYAKKVAAHLGTDHHELYLSPQDALNVIPQISTLYDEPFADISAIPTYLVSRFARQDVTVALSGDGGDEMLGGYNRHITAPQIWAKVRHLPPAIRAIMSSALLKLPERSWNKILPFIPQAGTRVHKAADAMKLKSPDDIFMRLISRWSDPEALVKGGYEAEFPLTSTLWDSPSELSFAESMMYKDTLSYLPNDILAKVDRASMALSLETRAPLLDRRIYEYAWSLPESVKIRNGKGKWLLRQVLGQHVPSHLFERPKQGFAIPVGEWLRGPLRDWAETLLDQKMLEDENILDPRLIRDTWNDHLKGHGNHADRIWTVLMFMAWKEKWM